MPEDRDPGAAASSPLHLQMKPLTVRSQGERQTGAWAVFGWSMIIFFGAFVFLVVLVALAFFGEPGPPSTP